MYIYRHTHTHVGVPHHMLKIERNLRRHAVTSRRTSNSRRIVKDEEEIH